MLNFTCIVPNHCYVIVSTVVLHLICGQDVHKLSVTIVFCIKAPRSGTTALAKCHKITELANYVGVAFFT